MAAAKDFIPQEAEGGAGAVGLALLAPEGIASLIARPMMVLARATHPLVVEQLADLAQIPVRYLGWHQAGELNAAITAMKEDGSLNVLIEKYFGAEGLKF